MDNSGIKYNWDAIADVDENIIDTIYDSEEAARYGRSNIAQYKISVLSCIITLGLASSEPTMAQATVNFDTPTTECMGILSDYIDADETIDHEFLRQSLKDETLELSSLPDDWDGEGAYRISKTSISHILDLLDNDRIRLELITFIYPNQNGFVSIQWDNNDEEMIGLEVGRRHMSYFVKKNSGCEYHDSEEFNSENLNRLFSCLASL